MVAAVTCVGGVRNSDEGGREARGPRDGLRPLGGSGGTLVMGGGGGASQAGGELRGSEPGEMGGRAVTGRSRCVGPGRGDGFLVADVGEPLRTAVYLGGTGDLEEGRTGGNSTIKALGWIGTSGTEEESGDSKRSGLEGSGHRVYSFEKSCNKRKSLQL